jgi:hypothetical protein
MDEKKGIEPSFPLLVMKWSLPLCSLSCFLLNYGFYVLNRDFNNLGFVNGVVYAVIPKG